MVKAIYSPDTEITARNLTMKISAWADIAPEGVTTEIIINRLYHKWTPEEAVSMELKKWRGKPQNENQELTALGLTMKIKDWADVAPEGVTAHTIYNRLRRGWTADDAVSLPVRGLREKLSPVKKEHKSNEPKYEYQWVFKRYTSSSGMYVKQKVRVE